MKTCTRCGKEKSLEDFYKDKRSSDGLYSKCKACHNKVSLDWQKRNPEPGRLRALKWYHENPGGHQKNTAKYRQDPEYRKKTNQWNATYKARNKAKINAINAARRAAQLQATPPWLTTEMKAEIEAFYVEARRLTEVTGNPYQVDHIHALLGENFCGLHVPWNLQILTAPANQSKKNKLILN